jgi:hypothetical protein
MIRCDQCDNRVISGWKWCPYCGYPQTNEGVEAAQRELTVRQQGQQPIYDRWRAFHAAAWPKLWGIETTDPLSIEAGLEIVIAPSMPEHAAKSVAAIFNQQAQDSTHRETLITILELLNPLHGEIDRQTYDERYKQGFDAPAEAEYTVDITARMERDLTQAVLILENRLRGK